MTDSHSAARTPATGNRLSRRLFVTGAAATGLAAAGTAVAQAAPGRDFGRPRPAKTLDVVLHPDSLTAPDKLPTGVVRFQVSVSQPAGRALLLIRLRDGASIEEFLANLARTSSHDPAERAQAARDLDAAAEYLGGAGVSGTVKVGFTRILGPGTYHLVNFNYASATETPPVKVVTAADPCQGGYPLPDDVIIHTHRGDDWGFDVPTGTLKASGSHQVFNSTGSAHEVMLAPVKPGTTVAQVEEYYASMKLGKVPPPDKVPLTGWPNGLGVIAPGGSAVLHTDFPPGEYLMFSYITNTDTGYPRAYEGMFRLTKLV
ncbi:hypothetical protein [Amycolatopsis nigrescens]|uniref:hypothetical protein n=1 Tax=Amycolatopsis nigrescens TaxID=381445 RepID=UPI0003690334|nr:hypothetical protein [Amycolatopsis nigrescens]